MITTTEKIQGAGKITTGEGSSGDLGAFPDGVALFLTHGVSVFRSCFDTEPLTAVEAVEAIRAIGGCLPTPEWARGWREAVEKMRACTNQTQRLILKRALPAITWSGVFSGRSNTALVKHSGLICIDLDKIGGRDKIDVVLEKLRSSPYLWAAFMSPSGTGLKAIFRCDADAESHGRYFKYLSEHVHSLTGLKADPTPDVSRLCYVSFDVREILIEEAP